MTPTDPKSYLWAALCRAGGFAGADPEDVGVDEMHRAVKKVVGRGTVQRIKEGETSVGVETLVSLAGALGLEVWQLLLPERQRAAVAGMSAEALEIAAIYDRVSPEDRRYIKAVALASESAPAMPADSSGD